MFGLGALLLSGTIVSAAEGRCISATVQDPVRLPDGTEHPAGRLTLCLDRVWSPVFSRHRTSINGRTVSLLISRHSVIKGPSPAYPFMTFYREPDGRLRLVGYTLPCHGGMETYRLDQPPGGDGHDSLLAAGESKPSGETKVRIAATNISQGLERRR